MDSYQLQEEPIAIDSLVQNYKMAINLIKKNNGSVQEGNDIYQEALISFWIKASDPQFTLTCKISSFIYTICLLIKDIPIC